MIPGASKDAFPAVFSGEHDEISPAGIDLVECPSFTNSDGLFTVSGEKVVTVKADIVGAVSAGKTIALAVNSASGKTAGIKK